jgi:hypothetical protein
MNIGLRTAAACSLAFLIAGHAGVHAAPVAAAPSLPASAPANGPRWIDTLEERAQQALWYGDFDELQSLYAQARASTERSAEGFRAIERFRSGVARTCNGVGFESDAYFAQLVALTRRWADQHPESGLAVLLHARAIYAQAWYHRGGGYASSVTDRQWEVFHHEIDTAVDFMAQHAALLKNDSTMELYLVMLGNSGGWSWDRLWAIGQSGLGKDPRDLGIWDELSYARYPKWGGSWPAEDALIREAASREPTEADGDMLYARLYGGVAGELQGSLFSESRGDWARMKRGWGEIVARYPTADHLNFFAHLACIAEDRDTTRDLMTRIGKPTAYNMWGWGAEGRNRYEQCRRWVDGP